jgi:hypothetical protein
MTDDRLRETADKKRLGAVLLDFSMHADDSTLYTRQLLQRLKWLQHYTRVSYYNDWNDYNTIHASATTTTEMAGPKGPSF